MTNKITEFVHAAGPAWITAIPPEQRVQLGIPPTATSDSLEFRLVIDYRDDLTVAEIIAHFDSGARDLRPLASASESHLVGIWHHARLCSFMEIVDDVGKLQIAGMGYTALVSRMQLLSQHTGLKLSDLSSVRGVSVPYASLEIIDLGKDARTHSLWLISRDGDYQIDQLPQSKIGDSLRKFQ